MEEVSCEIWVFKESISFWFRAVVVVTVVVAVSEGVCGEIASSPAVSAIANTNKMPITIQIRESLISLE